MKTIQAVMALFLLVVMGPSLQGQYNYPFQNPNLPTDRRIQNVLSLLTLQEKIDLLGKSLNVPRLGIHGSGKVDSIPGSSGQFEGLHGLAVGGPNNWGRRSPGAPGLFGGTSTIPTTQFPQPVGLGETWDPALIEKAATEEGHEARYIFQSFDRGGLIVRAPNADLARDPRWGRSEESYGEDPYLVGTMSVAFVKGLQGDDPRTWLTASLVKHFLANSNEDGRAGSSSNFDDRLLHEYYSAPFRMAIEQGGANAIMTAY
ncbi:MAG: glycoside hydrolase family 3 N-terminal domain-containing protein, partial [Acidobacteriaceae bacterium]